MVFGIILDWRSDSSRIQRSASPESPSLIRSARILAVVGAIVFEVIQPSPIRAQQPPTASNHPEFEVATLKTSPPPQGDTIVIGLGTFRNGKLTFTNASLSDLLKFAYNISSDSQLSGPDWIKSKDVRFDVVALAPGDTTREQLALMLQTLLADRLKLVLHREQKELRFLALVEGKNGSKLHIAKSQPAPDTTFNIAGRIVRNQISMPQLTLLLSRFERQTVMDMTGLKGFYEVQLEWTPDDTRGREPTDSPLGPSIYTAVQEQLGLKLEARRGPVEVLVVDSAEKVPTDN
jgi:uncharacterized protein (TIGR03435 family)